MTLTEEVCAPCSSLKKLDLCHDDNINHTHSQVFCWFMQNPSPYTLTSTKQLQCEEARCFLYWLGLDQYWSLGLDWDQNSTLAFWPIIRNCSSFCTLFKDVYLLYHSLKSLQGCIGSGRCKCRLDYRMKILLSRKWKFLSGK